MDDRDWFDRHKCVAEVIDDHYEDDTYYNLVFADDSLHIVTNAESSDDGYYLYYDEEVEIRPYSTRDVLNYWHDLANG